LKATKKINVYKKRLIEVAKEFNVGKDTLINFLLEKGFPIDVNHSNPILTREMYEMIIAGFNKHKQARRRVKNITIPKGSLIRALQKPVEELDIDTKRPSDKLAKSKSHNKNEKEAIHENPCELNDKTSIEFLPKKKSRISRRVRKIKRGKPSPSPLNPYQYNYGYIKIISTSMGNRR
jgi:hypothetical protein